MKTNYGKNPIFSPIHIFSALCKNNSSPILSGARKAFGEMSAMRYARQIVRKAFLKRIKRE
jgi:hypothetical protein